MADIKYERNGITKMAGERFKDALIAEGWTVVSESLEADESSQEMTKKEIIEHLTTLGVEFNQADKKSVLMDLLEKSINEV